MTPPITPPEKRPDRHYNFGRMNMVFALSSLGLLAVTLWMAFADYAQPWKRFQAEFRSLERQKLMEEAEAEREPAEPERRSPSSRRRSRPRRRSSSRTATRSRSWRRRSAS